MKLTANADRRTRSRGCTTATVGTLESLDPAAARRGGGRFPGEGHRVPRRDGGPRPLRQPCPVCGAPVQRIVYARNETNYCAAVPDRRPAARRSRALAAAEGGLAEDARGDGTAARTERAVAARASASAGATISRMQKKRRQAIGLVASAIAGTIISLTTALGLVPRVRSVDVIAVFGGAFGAGAALASAVFQFRALSRAAASPSAVESSRKPDTQPSRRG